MPATLCIIAERQAEMQEVGISFALHTQLGTVCIDVLVVLELKLSIS